MTTVIDTVRKPLSFRKGQHQRPLADNCRMMYAVLISPLRHVSREHGYALAQHGSLSRDIDLVAVPWVSEASEPKVLAEAIRAKAEEVVGIAFDSDRTGAANPEFFVNGMPGAKPHGRLTWTFHLGGGPYIDLSVMPPIGYVGPFDKIKIEKGLLPRSQP